MKQEEEHDSDGSACSCLLPTLRKTSAQFEMFSAGQTVVIGVSGGADSTALLFALAGLRAEWELSLVACHVHHGIRGVEADADAAYVEELCTCLNIACRVERADVPAIQKRRHVSMQQAARDVRHSLLRQVAGEVGAARIALAHTHDDRTETILLNILRGGGLEGLAGFPAAAFPLVRPLYDVTRAQVERYCAEHGLHPQQDSSNLKTAYRRNRIRLDLLPNLRAFYNPHADDALLRLADLARDDNALLEEMASQTLAKLLASASFPADNKNNTKANNALALPQSDVNALPIALRRRVLRQAIALVRGHLQDVTFEILETFLSACEKPTAYSVELPSTSDVTVRLRCNGQEVQIAPSPALTSPVPWQVTLAVPGQTFVPQAGVTIRVNVCTPDEAQSLSTNFYELNHHEQGSPLYMKSPSSSDEGAARRGVGVRYLQSERGGLFLWAKSDITLPLVVRSWLPGDRMRPRGLSGTKKLQDIFTDAGIPAGERGQVPILVEDAGRGRILVVGDLRVDATATFATRLPDAHSALLKWAIREESDAAENEELFAITFEYE